MSGVISQALAALSGNDPNAPQIPNAPAPQIPYAADNTSAPAAVPAPEAPAAPAAAPAVPPSVTDAAKAMQPGSFGHKLATALAVAHSVLATGMGGLGDAAAVGTVPSGGGALTGIARTMSARNTRLSEEQKQQAETERENTKTAAQVAFSNAQMAHEQALTHQLGQAAIDSSVKSGSEMLDRLRSSPVPAQTIQAGLDSDQLRAFIGGPGFSRMDPKTKDMMTAYPAGQRAIGENPDGSPRMRTIYDVVELPTHYTLTKADQDVLRTIPRYKDANLEGTTMSGAQVNQLYQESQNIAAATAARNKTLADYNVEAKKADWVNLGPEWNNALQNAGNDPFEALSALSSNTAFMQSHPRFVEEVHDNYGGDKGWEELVEKRDAATQKAQDEKDKLAEKDPLFKMETEPSEIEGEKASAAIAQLNGMASSEKDPARQVRIAKMIGVATAAHNAYEQDKREQANATEAARQGDPKAAGEMLANGDVTLQDLRTRGMNEQFVLDAIKAAKTFKPDYSATDEINASQVAKSPAQNQFFGSANSLLVPGGTLQQLTERGKDIPDTWSPTFNTIADWTKAASGSGPIAAYAATALGVADDYSKVMTGGVGSDASRLQALNLIKAAASPEQRTAAIQSIRDSVRSQRDSRIGRNQFLRRMYGDTGDVQQSVAQVKAPAGSKLARDKNGVPVGYVLNGKYTAFAPAGK